MTEENGFSHWRGVTDAEMAHLRELLDRVEKGLGDHRTEEREVWERFEKALKELDEKLDSIDRWRSKVIGYASAVSLFIGGLIHLVWEKLK